MGRKTTRRRQALGGGGQVRASVAAVWLIGGFVLFKKLEPGIADVA